MKESVVETAFFIISPNFVGDRLCVSLGDCAGSSASGRPGIHSKLSLNFQQLQNGVVKKENVCIEV